MIVMLCRLEISTIVKVKCLRVCFNKPPMLIKVVFLYIPIRTIFDLAVEFQDVAMSICFDESGDFVIDVMRTVWVFDSHLNEGI